MFNIPISESGTEVKDKTANEPQNLQANKILNRTIITQIAFWLGNQLLPKWAIPPSLLGTIGLAM